MSDEQTELLRQILGQLKANEQATKEFRDLAMQDSASQRAETQQRFADIFRHRNQMASLVCVVIFLQILGIGLIYWIMTLAR